MMVSIRAYLRFALAFGLLISLSQGDSLKRSKLFVSKADNRDGAALAEEFFYRSNGRDSVSINYEDGLGRVFYRFYDSAGRIERIETRSGKSDSLEGTQSYRWVTNDSAAVMRTTGGNSISEFNLKYHNPRYGKFGEIFADTISASDFKTNGTPETGWTRTVYDVDDSGYAARVIATSANGSREYSDTTTYANFYQNHSLIKYSKTNSGGTKHYFYEYKSIAPEGIRRPYFPGAHNHNGQTYYDLSGRKYGEGRFRTGYYSESPANFMYPDCLFLRFL